MSKHIVMPVVILVAICVIVAGLLSFTDFLTAEKIDANTQARTAKLIAAILPDTDKITPVEAENMQRYTCLDAGGNNVGQVVILESSGYGGEISVMVGFLPDKTVAGIRILASNETPGLGQRAGEAEFYDQYSNKKVESFIVIKSTPDNDEDIAAISGATITSKAVTKAVNDAIAVVNGEAGA